MEFCWFVCRISPIFRWQDFPDILRNEGYRLPARSFGHANQSYQYAPPTLPDAFDSAETVSYKVLWAKIVLKVASQWQFLVQSRRWQKALTFLLQLKWQREGHRVPKDVICLILTMLGLPGLAVLKRHGSQPSLSAPGWQYQPIPSLRWYARTSYVRTCFWQTAYVALL